MLDLIPNPKEMTDFGLLTLAVFYTFVVLWIQHKLWGLWYRKNLEKNTEEFRIPMAAEIKRLRAKLKEYERTHRTIV